jgi:hypothetical protein
VVVKSLPAVDDPAVERDRRTRRLVEGVGGERRPLEELRSNLLERMLRPDRSGVAAQLRIVEGALSLIPFPLQEPWTRMQRVHERRPRRW